MIDPGPIIKLARQIPASRLEEILSDPDENINVFGEDEKGAKDAILSVLRREMKEREFARSHRLTLTLPFDQWGAVCIGLHFVLAFQSEDIISIIKAMDKLRDGSKVQNVDTIEGVHAIQNLISKWGNSVMDGREDTDEDQD